MLNTIPQNFPFPDYEPATRAAVLNTCIKMNQYFREHDHIMISVSGGSDSDCIVHMVRKYFPEHLKKIHFVFVNTGLEYDATKRHLSDLENKYGITIRRIRGMSVVYACKKYGVPMLSKVKSKFLNLYVRGCPSGEKYVMGDKIKSYHAMQFTENQKKLAVYLKQNNILVSSDCCTKSKKQPIKKYMHVFLIDLNVTGERRAEGGQRALIHKSCFEQQKDIDKFMPLWWWNDDEKKDYKEKEGIVYSDCYEVYGMKRTGCCGCPFSLTVKQDLEIMREYEPRLFTACMHVFGKSYALMDKFNTRRKKCLPDGYEVEV